MSTYIGRDFPGISGSHPEQTVVCDLLPAHHRRRIQVQRLRKSKFTCEIRKIIESVFQSNDILASTDFQYWKYNWIHGQNSESPRIMRAACGIHCGDLAATLESLLIRKTDPLISNPSQEPPGTAPRLWFDVTEIFHTRHTYLIQCWYTKTADVFLLPSDDEGPPGTWECFWEKWLTCFRRPWHAMSTGR